MSSSEAIKAAMESCQKGIQLLEARVKQNGALTSAKEEERKGWQGRKTTHETNCNNTRNERNNQRADWNRRYNEEKNARRGDKERRSGACGSVPGCPSGFHETSSWYDWGNWSCNRECTRTDGDADRVARERVGAEPSEHHCQPFPEAWPGDAQLDTTPITLGCCANQTNVIGSNLNDSSIQQNNNCLSSLQDDYRIKKAEEEALKAAADKAASDRAAADKAAADKAASDRAAAATNKTATTNNTAEPTKEVASLTSDTESSSEAETDNRNMIMLIVAILICCCLCVSVLALMMML